MKLEKDNCSFIEKILFPQRLNLIAQNFADFRTQKMQLINQVSFITCRAFHGASFGMLCFFYKTYLEIKMWNAKFAIYYGSYVGKYHAPEMGAVRFAPFQPILISVLINSYEGTSAGVPLRFRSLIYHSIGDLE